MLEAVYIRVFDDNMYGTPTSQARKIQVWKKNIDYHARNNDRVINLINTNTSTSNSKTATYVGTGMLSTGSTIYPQDRVNTYNTSMMLRITTTSLTDTITGGYAICRPITQTELRFKLTLTKGSDFEENYNININGENYEIHLSQYCSINS